MDTSRNSRIATLAAAGLLLVFVAGCQAMPVPIEIDLLAELGDARTGVVEESVRSGITPHLVMDLPEYDDNCFDVSEDQLPVTVVHARVDYKITVRYEGPRLSGRMAIQPYLAGPSEALFSPASAFGDRVRVNLASRSVNLNGTAQLTKEQVTALNEGNLCWGLQLRGTDLAAASDGMLRATYDVRALSIRAGVALF